MPAAHLYRRLVLLGAMLLAIVAGSALRLTRIGLPWWFVKYGGAVIWGAMVYCLVALPMARAVATSSSSRSSWRPRRSYFDSTTRPGSTRSG